MKVRSMIMRHISSQIQDKYSLEERYNLAKAIFEQILDLKRVTAPLKSLEVVTRLHFETRKR